MTADQRSWRRVRPCGSQGLANGCFRRRFQQDAGRASGAPYALDRNECPGIFADEQLLLVWRDSDHAPAGRRITERREDRVADPEVGMVHVGRFDRLGKGEGELSKIIGRHGLHLCFAASFTTVLTPRNVARVFSVFSRTALENDDSLCLFFDSQ